MRIRYMLAIAVAIPMLVALLTWLTAIVIARSRRRIDRCPICKSNRVRPSWPTIMDKFLWISATTPFRCEACLKRFYARKSLAYRIPLSSFPGAAVARTPGSTRDPLIAP
jgi:hypothetical protein